MTRISLRAGALVLMLVGFASGCARTVQTDGATPSGFLGDYSSLGVGKGEQAQLLFIDPNADFSQYKQVIVDPVTVWRGGDSKVADLSREDAQRLADRLHTDLTESLSAEFELVQSAQPGTLRIRAAITEARRSRVVADLISTVMPPARILSEVKNLATGTQAFVGRAGLELEILDAVSGQRLIAAVDERSGGKTLEGSLGGRWSDVEAAYDYWAELIAARLAVFRAVDEALQDAQ